jgi:hypothetical protein
MAFFRLDRLGIPSAGGEPQVIDVRIHGGVNFNDAFDSAIEIVRTSKSEGVGGFRLTDSAGNSRIWLLEDGAA